MNDSVPVTPNPFPVDRTHGDDSSIVLINTFHPKPGNLDEFLETQIAEAGHLGDAARATGWLGNRIHRARDGRTAVIVTAFASEAARKRWAESELFADHLTRIKHLLDRVESNAFDLVFESGSFLAPGTDRKPACRCWSWAEQA
jgi:heme-degrading monooxygenase HmoA